VTTGPTGAASTGATGSASIVLVTTPAFVNSATASTPVGSTFSIAVTATGSPTPTITETGSLPSGVTFVDNGNGTATFSGTSAVPSGSYPFTLTATNAAGSGTQSFVLNITQAPTITSAAAAALQIGIAGTFTVTTSGTPAPSLTESGTLPSGVIFTDNGDGTATLSGTPAAGTVGSYSLNVSATNSQGSVSQTFTLYILSASLAASGTISSGASVSTSTTVSAGPTYLILAFDHDSGNTGNTLTASSSGFSTAPVLTAVGSQQNYDNNAAHYSAWYTTGGAGSGTFTVALANSTTKGANIEVIQLGGNNTSAPTVNGNLGSTNSGATTANKGTTGDANLPAAPAAGDLEVIFDTATGNQGASSPASSPSSLVLVPSTYSAGSNVTVGVLSGPATQAETLTWANSVVWGTMSIEIAHG